MQQSDPDVVRRRGSAARSVEGLWSAPALFYNYYGAVNHYYDDDDFISIIIIIIVIITTIMLFVWF